MDETSQVPCKERLHVHKVSDCARFFSCEPFAMRRCCLLFSRTRSAPRNWTRFAAQYLARGLPCERFTAALASRTSCITRGRGGWLDLPRGGLSPPILCQLPGALRNRLFHGTNEPDCNSAPYPGKQHGSVRWCVWRRAGHWRVCERHRDLRHS